MKRLAVLLAALCVILSGCWDKKMYEEIGFILQMGIESSKEEGELLVTFTSPVIGPETENKIEVLATTSDILRGARQNARRIASRSIEAGKVQQFLFSEEIARKGIHNITEVLQRDPANPALSWITVVEGSPNEMIQKSLEFKDKPRTAIYINQLLEGNAISSYIPETRVYDFDILYFAPGIDPMAPLIKLAPDGIMVIGSALFSDDKMVGKLNHNQTILLLEMRNMAKRPEYIAPVPSGEDMPVKEDLRKKERMAVMFQKCKTRINVDIKDDKPVVDMSLSFEVTLDEYVWDSAGSQSTQEKIENHLEDVIKKECREVLKYIQEVGSDPIGIGDTVRAKYNSYWKSVDWKDAYRDAQMNVDVDVEIMQHGAIN